MDKLERKIQQRIHFHKAMAELGAIMEYFLSNERIEYDEMDKIIKDFNEKVTSDSPIA